METIENEEVEEDPWMRPGYRLATPVDSRRIGHSLLCAAPTLSNMLHEDSYRT